MPFFSKSFQIEHGLLFVNVRGRFGTLFHSRGKNPATPRNRGSFQSWRRFSWVPSTVWVIGEETPGWTLWHLAGDWVGRSGRHSWKHLFDQRQPLDPGEDGEHALQATTLRIAAKSEEGCKDIEENCSTFCICKGTQADSFACRSITHSESCCSCKTHFKKKEATSLWQNFQRNVQRDYTGRRDHAGRDHAEKNIKADAKVLGSESISSPGWDEGYFPRQALENSWTWCRENPRLVVWHWRTSHCCRKRDGWTPVEKCCSSWRHQCYLQKHIPSQMRMERAWQADFHGSVVSN